MDDQNRNLILATALSFLVILVWFVLFPPEEPAVDPNATPATASQTVATDEDTGAPLAAVPQLAGDTASAPAAGDGASVPAPDAAPQEDNTARVAIATPRLEGSISLRGGRIDDLRLREYHETLDPASPIVTLLAPVGSADAYYALHGWAPGGDLTAEEVPGPNTVWRQAGAGSLAPGSPVTLEWDSPAGLTFRRQIALDDHYLFTITQSVTNTSDRAVRAAPYGIIARHGLPDLTNFFILHEGVVAYGNGSLVEEDYDALTELPVNPRFGARAQVDEDVTGGWVGFTDKYWMTTLIPPAEQSFDRVMLYQGSADIYQTQTIYPAQEIAPGATVTNTSRLFAGAKEWEVIRAYQNEAGVPAFLDSIDWGWFFFLTKPIFAVLHWLNAMIGNMGWAIIALTLIIKALLLPLAYKSYVSMAKMKELQPEMEKIKERAGDDRQKLQQEMMALYKKERVNPASGCLPILLQIPIFFSLYKVIFVTIELRHAPWIGWIRDLSAPDPSSIFNLFGLLPWPAPEPGTILALIFIGALPLALGVSMWLQQKLNPAPTDPTQAAIFAWMPWVFMFMLGSFASGLVLYWIANNTITFMQQYAIMRSQGYKPDVFGNIMSSIRRKTPEGK